MLEKEYLTSREVAQKLKVARYRIYEWVRDDKIPYLRTVGRILFDPVEIEQWLKRERMGSEQKAFETFSENNEIG